MKCVVTIITQTSNSGNSICLGIFACFGANDISDDNGGKKGVVVPIRVVYAGTSRGMVVEVVVMRAVGMVVVIYVTMLMVIIVAVMIMVIVIAIQ